MVSSFRAICAQRGREWTDYVVDLITSCPYARNRNLKGLEGTLAFLDEYKRLLEALLRESRLVKLIVEDCAGRWDVSHRRIETFLVDYLPKTVV